MRRLLPTFLVFALTFPIMAHAGVEEGIFAMRMRDFETALKELTPEAESGHPFAQEALGDIYASGLGVKQDMKVACDWWERAALQKRPAAQHNLGICFVRGEGRVTDVSQAITWLQKAADLGYHQALCSMGELFMTSDAKIGDAKIRAPRKGIALCMRAAILGSARAQMTIAGLYLTGSYLEKDDIEASNWMEKAANQGVTKAEYTFGLMNRYGHGRPKNNEAAAMWFEKAAKKGNTSAQYKLGKVLYILAIDPKEKTFDAGKIVSAYYWLSVSRPFIKDKTWIEDAEQLVAQMRNMIPEEMTLEVDSNVEKYVKELKTSVENLN